MPTSTCSSPTPHYRAENELHYLRHAKGVLIRGTCPAQTVTTQLPHALSTIHYRRDCACLLLATCTLRATNLEGNRFCVGDDEGGLGTADTAGRTVDVNLAALVGEVQVTHTILLQTCEEAWNGRSLQFCNNDECRNRMIEGGEER